MRRRILSLVLAAMALLALASSAFAQVTVQITRADQIIGFAETQGIPAVAEGTFVPRVLAADPVSGSLGTLISPYVTDLDAWFATNFGFRPSTPTTFLLFSNGEDLVAAANSLGSPAGTGLILGTPSHLMQATESGFGIQPGEWVILVNLDIQAATETSADLTSRFASEIGFLPIPLPTEMDGMRLIQWSMAREYAMLMEMLVAGTAGPEFFREGLADAISFRIVPGTPTESGRAEAVAQFQLTNPLPTVSDLEQNWDFITRPGGLIFDVARGIAFLSTNTVFNQVGGASALNVLQRVAAGENFESALQSVSGFSLFDLNSAFQSLIPTP